MKIKIVDCRGVSGIVFDVSASGKIEFVRKIGSQKEKIAPVVESRRKKDYSAKSIKQTDSIVLYNSII